MEQLFDGIGTESRLSRRLSFQVPIEEGGHDATKGIIAATNVNENRTGEGFKEIGKGFGSGH
jgi:hypothetical protein